MPNNCVSTFGNATASLCDTGVLQAWKSGFKLTKAVVLWGIYFAITPATMVWMIPPVLMSVIMADRWRDLPKTGSFVAVVLFWFLKFPLGSQIQWV